MAVLQFSRKRKTTPERCLSTENPLHLGVSRKTPQDAVSVAVEHVNFLRRSGVGITHALAAINLTPTNGEGWDAVMWAYAQAFERVRIA